MKFVNDDFNPVIAGKSLLDRNTVAFENFKNADVVVDNHFLYSAEAAKYFVENGCLDGCPGLVLKVHGENVRTVEKKLVDLAGNSKVRMPLTELLCRYLSTFFTKYVWLPLGVHALNICYLSLIFIIVGYYVVSFSDSFFGRFVGVLLCFLGFVFDCCDGEVARVRLENNAFGAWMDSTLDRVSELVLIGFLIEMAGGGASDFRAGMVALFGVFMINLTGAYVPERFRTNRHPSGGVPAAGRVVDWFDYGRSTYFFVILFFILINQAFIGLLFLGLTANLYWMVRLLTYEKKLKE